MTRPFLALDNTGYEPSRKWARKSDCSQAAAPRRSTHPALEIKFHTKIYCTECPWFRHVSGHPRGPGSYVKLDEQSNSSTRWVPLNGCSQGYYGQSPTRAIGTECCATRDDAIYDWSSLLARASPRRARQLLRPRRRSSSTHASTQQWS